MTITEFILARVAEDEEAARAATAIPERVVPPSDTRRWSNLPEQDTPAHWGWGGGPFRVSDAGAELVQALGLADRDDRYYVTAGGAWDDSEPTGARYDVATIPHDHDAARHIARHDPARVLRQCGAIRRIVEFHQNIGRLPGREVYADSAAVHRALGITLEHLAAIWSDHPDYQTEWAK